jgi:hypothetical protein
VDKFLEYGHLEDQEGNGRIIFKINVGNSNERI